jgi:type I phosphodiesterase/nucleotide pyrophosphatase
MTKGRAVLIVSAFAVCVATSLRAGEVPRLIVQITVDQLRGDLPLRYRDRFTDGGFRYFLSHGTWYASAHHPHAHTETIVGHTTLSTGAYPSRHGMVANTWYDREAGKFVTNIEDENYPIVPVLGEKQDHKGASPVTILTTTFGDELSIATEGRAKIYGVSVKDRGAVSMAGHSGKAFWFSTSSGCFVSSTFYYKDASQYPQWVKTKCEEHLADKIAGTTWEPLHDRAAYLEKNVTNHYPKDSRAEKNMQMLESPAFGSFGRTFPHHFAAGPGSLLYNGITISPRGDDLTLDFAKTLLREERLGKDDVTDYLSVSFSSTDLVGHWFSPASVESEDTILRLDRSLDDFISFIDKEVGLENTLIVLSADHGGIEYPEYLAAHGIDTGHLSEKTIMKTAEAAVAARYPGITGIISKLSIPYFYLDRNVIEKNHLDRFEVERVVARAVQHLDGVALAVARADMESGSGEADEELIRQIRRNYNPRRSGQIYIVQQAQWQIDPSSGPKLVQHGSPWAYDTYVPVAFAGGHVPTAMVWRNISTTDVAATLALMTRTKIPSGCVGAPLTEVLNAK